MARRRRKSQTGLDKAAIGIGRALGKALNRIQKIDSGVRKVMKARKRKTTKTAARARKRASGMRRRPAARRAPRRKKP